MKYDKRRINSNNEKKINSEEADGGIESSSAIIDSSYIGRILIMESDECNRE